jgi:hypothetical protein
MVTSNGYLGPPLRIRGMSRRPRVRILNAIFAEMGKLCRWAKRCSSCSVTGSRRFLERAERDCWRSLSKLSLTVQIPEYRQAALCEDFSHSIRFLTQHYLCHHPHVFRWIRRLRTVGRTAGARGCLAFDMEVRSDWCLTS